MADTLSENEIVNSWAVNAAEWIAVVQQKQIENRRLITDRAVVDTIVSVAAKSVFDIGCGEGWLARALVSSGLSVSGVDVIPALIREAEKSATGTFRVMAYEDISSTTIPDRFDAAVCNFSLFGRSSVDHIFNVLPAILNPGGYFIIQTLHPCAEPAKQSYAEGWRQGSWAGFNARFSDPAPWYFRTTEAWFNLFRDNGYQLVQIKEPVSPKTGQLVSLIMVGRADN